MTEKVKKAKWTLKFTSGKMTLTQPLGTNGVFDTLRILKTDPVLAKFAKAHNFKVADLWDNTDKVTRNLVFYGHKQKLSDKTAMPKGVKLTEKDRLTIMVATDKRLYEERLWNEQGGGGGGVKKSDLQIQIDNAEKAAEGMEGAALKAMEGVIANLKALL